MIEQSIDPASRARLVGLRAFSILLLAIVASFLVIPQPASSQVAARGDREIQEAVLRLFDEDPILDETAIGVRVDDGVATLQGLARDLRDRDRAARLTSRVRGVRSIIDSIRLPSLGLPDAAVAENVRDALRADPVTQDIDLSVSVTGGAVSFVGRVESLIERKAIYVIASGVRGVQGLNLDNVAVVLPENRPAEELEREIAARWKWNVWTTQADLSVAVEDGVARISGVVPSLWARDLAAELASVPGVARVDVSGVTFSPAMSEPAVRDRPRALSDQEIAQAIDRALLFDFEIFSSNVEVEVDQGTAVLSGTVPTLAQREKAASVVGDTVGVNVVRNNLAIHAPDAPNDERLVQLIEERLLRAPGFAETTPIGIRAQAGIVTLLGAVPDVRDKRRAEELVKRQYGVTGVVNALQLSGSDVPANQ